MCCCRNCDAHCLAGEGGALLAGVVSGDGAAPVAAASMAAVAAASNHQACTAPWLCCSTIVSARADLLRRRASRHSWCGAACKHL